MKTNKRHAVVALGSLLAAAVVSGVAVAGNPHGTPPGQAKQQSSGSTSSGVKPSSTTQHNTHAAAGSSQTKQYGNGQNAGQIARQNGAGASTDLYGPGNSQPHKASACSSNGKSHLVDVHALKHAGAGSCSSSSNSGSSSSSSSSSTAGTSASVSGSVAGATHSPGTKAGSSGSNGAFTPPSAARNSTGAGSVSGQAKPARPVVGAANFTG